MSKEERFLQALKDLFVGARVEGRSGYINLMHIKSRYFEQGVLPRLLAEIDEALAPFPEFREELFDRLYAFFSRYFSESGSIYFRHTPLHEHVYERVYAEGRDVALFWKTHMLYYVKTDRLYRSMSVEVDGFRFFFDVSGLEHRKGAEKRSLLYALSERRDDGTWVLSVSTARRGRKTSLAGIRKAMRTALGLPRYTAEIPTEETLARAIRVFERQAEVDFFIHKNARSFLREQFDLWLYHYMFRPMHEQGTLWSPTRVRQLQVLRDIAFKIIDFIAAFEQELVRIWNKPRFVLDAHYVITLDRVVAQEGGNAFLARCLTHPGMAAQVQEWRNLGMVPEDFSPEDVWEPGEAGGHLREPFRHLPLDTRYFPDLEMSLVALFDHLDEALDGWLIHSENYQALRTILPRFRGRVQTIYIDPPFNLGTGADFPYLVNYKDATWITMLENRLRLAREILDERGSIFVRCDDNGNMYVRLLMNQIFGDDHFHNEILINRKRQSIGTPTKFEVESEYLYWYSRGDAPYYKVLRRPRALVEFRWTGFLKQEERRPRERIFFGKTLTPPPGQHFSLRQEKVDKLLRDHFLRLRCRACGAVFYWDEKERGADFVTALRRRSRERFKYLDITPDTPVFGVRTLERCLACGADEWKVEYLLSEHRKITDNWKDIPSYEDTVGFRTQNAEVLLQRVIEATSRPGDLVMDFFLGSGTTVAVAHKMRRRWIGIEIGEQFYETVLPRMKRVLWGEQSGISRRVGWQGGGFFKYFRLEQYEDILRRAHYEDNMPPPGAAPARYLFFRDKKFLEGKGGPVVELEADRIRIHLERLYPEATVDLAESVACVTGRHIRRIRPDPHDPRRPGEVEFEDGSHAQLDTPPWEWVKPLVWW